MNSLPEAPPFAFFCGHPCSVSNDVTCKRTKSGLPAWISFHPTQSQRDMPPHWSTRSLSHPILSTWNIKEHLWRRGQLQRVSVVYGSDVMAQWGWQLGNNGGRTGTGGRPVQYCTVQWLPLAAVGETALQMYRAKWADWCHFEGLLSDGYEDNGTVSGEKHKQNESSSTWHAPPDDSSDVTLAVQLEEERVEQCSGPDCLLHLLRSRDTIFITR